MSVDFASDFKWRFNLVSIIKISIATLSESSLLRFNIKDSWLSQLCLMPNSNAIGNTRFRRDVVFKNVFRSLKQHLTDWFKNKSGFYEISDSSKRRRVYKDYILKFISDHVFKTEGYQNLKDFDIDLIAEYFGRIINPRIMPKTSRDYRWTSSIEAFNKCLYTYSDKKAYRLYLDKFFYVYFECFLHSIDFILHLNANKKLIECVDYWVEKSEIILNNFRQVQASIAK